MKKQLVRVAALFVIMSMLFAVGVSAEGVRWSLQTNGVAEVDMQAELRYRVDVYKDGKDINMTTTLGKSESDAVYLHSFMPYLIETVGEGSYTLVLNVLDDFGNVVSSSERTEAFEYKKPQKQLDALSDSYFDGGYFYFMPSSDEKCAGYSIAFALVYGDNKREFYSTYYTGERMNSLEKNDEGFCVFDLETIRYKYDQAITRNSEKDPGKYNPQNAKLSVGVKALSSDVLEYKSSETMYNISEKTDVFEKVHNGKIRVDVSKYGKNINDVIVLEIDKTYVSVFGKAGTNDVAPLLRNGRTMLPIRFIAENLGAEVLWDENTKTVTINKGDVAVCLVVGENTAKVNGEIKELDAPSFVDAGRTYLPVRFVAESLGAGVLWDDATKSVIISK